MSTKFNSAQNDERDVRDAVTADPAAPADAGGDSELNIQDLLKKYLPNYSEEKSDKPAAEASAPVVTEEVDELPSLAVEEETEEENGEEPFVWFGEDSAEEATPEESEETADLPEEQPAEEPADAPAEEESVPRKKLGGLFARLLHHEEPEEESAAPDSEIFSELVEESESAPAEDREGIFAPAAESASAQDEDADAESASEDAEVETDGGFVAIDGEETPGEDVIDTSGMDEKDISLWVALGMEDQLDKKMGKGSADKAADRLKDEQKEYSRQQKQALEYEYTDRSQIPQIADAYKFALKSLKIKMIAAAVLTVLLFFFENITLFGVQFSGALDPAVYPVVNIMMSLQLLLLVCALAYEQIFAGFTNLVTMRPTPESVLSVLSVFAVVYSVILAVIANPSAGGEPVLYNFPVAVVALLSLIFTYFNTKREAFSFNIVSSKRQKYVFNRIEATENSEESRVFGATEEGSPDVLRITRADFVDGYFARTGAILNSTRIYVGAMLSCIVAAAVLMAVFAMIGGSTSRDAITIAYLTLIGVVPASMFFTYSYPFYKANREAYEYDSTIVGEPSLEEYAGASIVSFDDKNVFPSVSVKVQNIKIYNNNRIDRVLYYAASAFCAAGGPLSDVFSLATMEMERSADVNILSAGVGYLETSVDGRQILFGRSAVLTELGFEVPVEVVEEDSYVQGDLSILYMLRDGALIAKMYIRYGMDADFEFILRQFTKGGTCVCVKTLDPNIDEEMIFSKVRGKQYPLKIVRNTEGTEAVERADSGIVTRGTTKSLLQVLSYCDMVLSVKGTNTVISIVSAIVSLLVLVIVMMSQNVGALKSWMVAANQLFWLIPAMLTTKLFIK
ncbi:MAG: hypothetical protein IJZ08_00470 [Clostridia bacterium]|nr:hypothetical protein [Clostridia bacterium]